MESSILNRADASADVDLSIIKVISFIAVTVVFAGLAGYFIAEANFFYGFLTLALFWVLFILQVFFIKDWARILIAVSLQSIVMLLPSAIIFSDNFSMFVLIALLALFGLLLFAENLGRNELANALKIPLWRTTRHMASKVIPATLTFIAIVYIFVADKSIIEKDGVQFVSEAILTPIVRTVIPEFSSKMSFDDLLQRIMEKQIGETAFRNLPAASREEALKRTRDSLTSYIGEVDTKAPLGSAIYGYFAERLTSASLVVKITVGLALITILWGVIKAITLILFLPIAALAIIVYEILVVLNFIVIQYESRSREIILLK